VLQVTNILRGYIGYRGRGGYFLGSILELGKVEKGGGGKGGYTGE